MDINTHAGHAWVGLRAQLGQVGPPPSQYGHPQRDRPLGQRYRGPSYQRRQERRQAARAAAYQGSPAAEVCDELIITKSKDAVKVTVETIEENQAEKVFNNPGKASDDETSEEATEKVEATHEDLECPICDFQSTWKSELAVHMSRKHSTIVQLDGNAEVDGTDRDEKYFNTEHYWKKGWLGISYQSFIEANEIIDSSDLSFEQKATEKTEILEARKRALGRSFHNFPPWSQ